MGGQGAPVWLAGVIEEGCEEFDQIQCNIRGCRTFQNEVDFRVSHSRRAVEIYPRVIGISLVVTYGEDVGGNRLVTLGLTSEERHRVTVSTHCEIGGEFV